MSNPVRRLVAQSSDGLRNFVAGLETDRDKASHSFYAPNALTLDQAMVAYRSAWLPRQIVDIPADDSCRKWRAWQAGAEQITAIEAEEKRLGIKQKVLRARRLARLCGGAALFIGTGTSQPHEPFKAEEVKKGGLKYVTVLSPRNLAAELINDDITSEFFGQPEIYGLAFRAGGATTRIHASRLVKFVGAPLPDGDCLSEMGHGWGDSVLYAPYDAIRNFDATSGNIASLIFEAKVDVIHTPEMMDKLQRDPRYEEMLLTRASLAARAKGINGTLLLDTTETYEQKSANFSTLPDILDRFGQIVAGASGIPVTRLFGRSAAGMNATGDGDERVYFDGVQADQELEIGPAMALLDDAIICSALGERPSEIFYTWVPLRQKTEKEVAEIGKLIADTGKVLKESALYREEVLAETVSNALIESGAMPGLEGAIGKHGIELDDPDEEELLASVGALPGHTAQGPDGNGMDPLPDTEANDAAPRTLYVRRDVLNGAQIIEWAKSQGFETTLPAGDLHITIAYSREPIDWMKAGIVGYPDKADGGMTIAPGGPRLMEQFGKATVLLVGSSALCWRHEEFRNAGASWDYPDYNPHITITYAAPEGMKLSEVEPYRGLIELGPEIFEEVDEGWADRVTEDERGALLGGGTSSGRKDE